MVAVASPVLMMTYLGGMLAALCHDPIMRCYDPKGLYQWWNTLQPEAQMGLYGPMLDMIPEIQGCDTTLYAACSAACGEVDAMSKRGCIEGCKFYKDGCVFLKNFAEVVVLRGLEAIGEMKDNKDHRNGP